VLIEGICDVGEHLISTILMLGLAIEAFRILHSFDSEKMAPLTSAHGKDNLICVNHASLPQDVSRWVFRTQPAKIIFDAHPWDSQVSVLRKVI